MAYSVEDYARVQQEKAQQLIEAIKGNLESFVDTDHFKEYLKFMTTMKNYSADNVLMIYTQCPQATRVAGLKAWNELGRYVNKGEHALKIYAPVKKRTYLVDEQTARPLYDDNGKARYIEQLTGFRLVNVFDVSQTHGKPIVTARALINDAFAMDEGATTLYERFSAYLNKHSSLRVVENVYDIVREGRGFFQADEQRISINGAEPSGVAKLKTLIHEYAHAQLHYNGSEFANYDRGHREAHAESVAYAVMSYLGFDTTPYSAPYIATWAKDIEVMKKALHEIQQTVTKTLHIVDMIQQLELQLQVEQSYSQQQHISVSHEALKAIFPNVRYVFQNKLAVEKSPQIPIVYFNRTYHRIEVGSYHIQNELLLDAHHTPISQQALDDKEILLLNVLYSSPSFMKSYAPFYKQFNVHNGVESCTIQHIPTGQTILTRDTLEDAKKSFIQYVEMETTTLKHVTVNDPSLKPFEKVVDALTSKLAEVQPPQQQQVETPALQQRLL
ncbi:MAG: ArdC family protein [Caryophanon sp.]|nr:ArdC family protein [Caryophanon sp.]